MRNSVRARYMAAAYGTSRTGRKALLSVRPALRWSMRFGGWWRARGVRGWASLAGRSARDAAHGTGYLKISTGWFATAGFSDNAEQAFNYRIGRQAVLWTTMKTT